MNPLDQYGGYPALGALALVFGVAFSEPNNSMERASRWTARLSLLLILGAWLLCVAGEAAQ